jgi:CAAX protease family protein
VILVYEERKIDMSWLRRWRVPVLLVAMLVVMALAQQLTVALSDTGIVDLVVGVAVSAVTLFCYVRLSRYVERRQSIVELPRDRAVSGLVWGSVMGAGAFVVTMLIILVFGGWQVSAGTPWKFLATLGVMACAAVTEEVVFRGIVFRITEERFGTWIALTVSAVLFGLIHLAGISEASTGAMVWGAVAIMLQGGLMLAAAYVATRALWLPIGVHFAWNVAEAGFGTAVSGKTSEFGSLIQTTLSGPAALTGGSFGPEAGAAGIVSSLVAATLLLRYSIRKGRVLPRPTTVPTGR